MTTEAKTPTRAMVALGLAVAALAQSLFGTLVAEEQLAGSPLNAARNRPGADFTHASQNARMVLVGYVLPFVLGVAAAVLGGRLVRTLDHHRTTGSATSSR